MDMTFEEIQKGMVMCTSDEERVLTVVEER